MTIIDISVPLFEGTPVWPGETPFTASSQQIGDATISVFSFGSHTGTHIDAPLHQLPGGLTTEKIPLDVFMGEVLVCHFKGNKTIDLKDLRERDLNGVERILFRTDNSDLWQHSVFSSHYTSLSLSAAEYLVDLGVKLVGIDYLSIEAFGSKGNPVHKALLGRGVTILEGLNLASVKEGHYTLVALPLSIPGADGSPVRAVLIS
ncbi:MAG: cyclase family protein [Proteobacteria bacterium]|nr:cyclase family protein [Pseudomonadota bacterium]